MINKLMEQIEVCGNPSVVGLDPLMEMIPGRIKSEMEEIHGTGLNAVAEMFLAFNREIIDGVCDIVPAVKPQIAMYERLGVHGIRAYIETVEYAHKRGMVVIGDIKRGDISSTAEAYAAHIGGTAVNDVTYDPWQEDWVTLNPYLGADSMEPFLKVCRQKEKGLFILVKTSNPGSSDLQDIKLADSGLTLYEHVGDLVKTWGGDMIGKYGYSKIGAVVGATHKEQGADLRKRMGGVFFLVPGYGAQGASGKDLRGFFDSEGKGCIVNSSRGIIAAWKKDEKYGEKNVSDAARDAAIKMKKDLGEALGYV